MKFHKDECLQAMTEVNLLRHQASAWLLALIQSYIVLLCRSHNFVGHFGVVHPFGFQRPL